MSYSCFEVSSRWRTQTNKLNNWPILEQLAIITNFGTNNPFTFLVFSQFLPSTFSITIWDVFGTLKYFPCTFLVLSQYFPAIFPILSKYFPSKLPVYFPRTFLVIPSFFSVLLGMFLVPSGKMSVFSWVFLSNILKFSLTFPKLSVYFFWHFSDSFLVSWYSLVLFRYFIGFFLVSFL